MGRAIPQPDFRFAPALGLLAMVAAIFLATGVSSASAQGVPPSIPATFYGAILVNGQPPADGTPITAQVNGKDCTQKNNPGVFQDNGIAVYAITVVHSSQVEGCGTDGAEVTFFIGGEQAKQKGTFKAGFVQVGLSIGDQEPQVIPTPEPGSSGGGTQATPTDPTAAAATATQQALFTPAPAPSVLPTDDAIFPTNESGTAGAGSIGGQSTPGSENGSSSGDDDDDGGSSALVPVLAVVGVIAVAGAAGGVFYARRKGPGPQA